ncbi:MAG TPA: ribosome-associated translation inhibitor RaiA [Candidatus Magasanikbacteria bacterium]|nr:ribosome-associated translation inhibitor RaiA [Candidatus Magasanikbacteria bacterium]
MIINIKAKGMDMTPAIKKYVEEKAKTLTKYFENIDDVDVIVGMETHHHNKGKIFYAEFNLQVPGKNLTVRKDAIDLYKAIDKVRDHLKVELEKIKEKMRAKDKKVLREQKGYQE